MKNNSPRIKVTKNGPYLVSGTVPLDDSTMVIGNENEPESWAKTKDYPEKAEYALCRCGKSKTMPFCDGAHVKSGFDGTEKGTRKPFSELADRIEGPGLDMDDAGYFCAGLRQCHRAGSTWGLIEKSSGKKNQELAIEECDNCAAGRLIPIDKKTGKPVDTKLDQSISLLFDTQCNKDGPIWVKGGIQVEAADGFQYEVRNRVTLCRCGKSTHKPYCDGRHTE